MKAILPNGMMQFGVRQLLSAQSRLHLFKQSRCLAACVMLLLFPMLALLSLEPIAVLAALMLFGILPAVIAMDVRRPANLDRAVILSLFVAAMMLFAGTLRGLNGVGAIALLGVMGIEATLLVRPSSRAKLIIIFTVGAIAMASSSVIVEPSFGVGQWSNAAILIALVTNIWMLVQGMSQIMHEKNATQKSFHNSGSEIASVIAQTVVSLNRSGAILHVSDNAERLLNIPGNALLGRGLVELILVSERPALLQSLSDAIVHQKTCTLQLRMRASVQDANPSYRWIELILSPSQENAAHLVGAMRDINEQMMEETQIKRLEDEAEQAKLARGAFLSTVNHELRTPLNAIIGFSEILANPSTIPVDAMKTQEYATLIHGAGRDLFRKISAMVDVTRLDSGVYEIEKEPTDIRSLLESAIETFKQEPDSLGAPIEFHDGTANTSDQALDIDVDARAIRSVMHQLLSNAAKFGGKAKPIRVSLHSSGQRIKIAITDTGPGIPADKLELLGNHFARLDETLNRAHGGIGLGLSLTRGIMALHHGSMSFESKVGKGTTVNLILPRQSTVQTAPNNLVQFGLATDNANHHISMDQPQGRRHG